MAARSKCLVQERFLKGSSPLQGNTRRAASGGRGNPRARSAVLACASGVLQRKVQGSLWLMAAASHSLHTRLSDVYFPAGTRPDLDIEQRISPVKRFLGSLIYI